MSPRLGTTKTQSAPRDRRLELVEANARLDEAEKLGPVVASMREDVARMESKRDRLAALGDARIEIAQESYHPQYGISVTWEPIRSKLSGNELAAEVENAIVGLRQELARAESRLAGLLA